jgi:exodeoxyribonuclease V gamma subunit
VLRTLPDEPAAAAAQLTRTVARLRREGRLPWGAPGEAVAAALQAEMAPVLAAWSARRAGLTVPAGRAPLAVALALPGRGEPLRLDAGLLPWLAGADGRAQLLRLSASRVTEGSKSKPPPRADPLVQPWLEQLALSASGHPCTLQVLGTDRIVTAPPVPEDVARAQLATLAAAWLEGTGDDGPWPTALKTGLAWLAEGRPAVAYEGSEQQRGEVEDPHLARLYPSWADLADEPRFVAVTTQLYGLLAAWLATLVIEPLPDAVAPDDDDGSADD